MAEPFGLSVQMDDEQRRRKLAELAAIANQDGGGFARGPGTAPAGPGSFAAFSKPGPGMDAGSFGGEQIRAPRAPVVEGTPPPMQFGAGPFGPSYSLPDPIIGAGINIRDTPEIQLAKMQMKRQADMGAMEAEVAAGRNQLLGESNRLATADLGFRQWESGQSAAQANANREHQTRLAEFGAKTADAQQKAQLAGQMGLADKNIAGQMQVEAVRGQGDKQKMRAELIARLAAGGMDPNTFAAQLKETTDAIDRVMPNALPASLDPTATTPSQSGLKGPPSAALSQGPGGQFFGEKGVGVGQTPAMGQGLTPPVPAPGGPAATGGAIGPDEVTRRANTALQQIRQIASVPGNTGPGGQQYTLNPALDAGGIGRIAEVVAQMQKAGTMTPEVEAELGRRIATGGVGDAGQFRKALGEQAAIAYLRGNDFGRGLRDPKTGQYPGSHEVRDPTGRTPLMTLRATNTGVRRGLADWQTAVAGGGGLGWVLGAKDSPIDQLPFNQLDIAGYGTVPLDRNAVSPFWDAALGGDDKLQSEARRLGPAIIQLLKMSQPGAPR